jgi:murein DD-endopeptidase MepM/ murein hydrolase activator NlpD
MRRWLFVPVAALLVPPAAASAQSQAPDSVGTSAPSVGAAEYGVPTGKATPLRVAAFSVSPSRLIPGTATTVRVRLAGGSARSRVRVVLVPAGSRVTVATLNLGWRRTGPAIVARWRPPGLAAGDYVARVHAVDTAGGTLRRTATATGKLPVEVTVPAAPSAPAGPAPGAGVFPVQGPWTFGGEDARFGAPRHGHIHQGQDIVAAEGTPLVSPLAGLVYWRSVQESGAGHYLVIRAVDGRDYVFMHLVAGSETVDRGDPVNAGELIGRVGSTGDASGPHLHFEIWPDGWYAPGSEPIDPLPALKAWAAALP